MSYSRDEVVSMVREALGDTNPSERVVSEFRYNDVIGRNVNVFASKVKLPRGTLITVTLVDGTYDYAVSATLAQQDIAQVILNSNGAELQYVPLEEFNAYYRQDSAQPRARGTPEEYTVYENASNLTRIRFGPTPSAADTADLYTSSFPFLLPEGPATAAVPFSPDLVAGLVAACAAEVALALSPERLAKLGLSKDVARKWLDDSETAIRGYNSRVRHLGGGQNHVIRYGGRRGRRVWVGA